MRFLGNVYFTESKLYLRDVRRKYKSRWSAYISQLIRNFIIKIIIGPKFFCLKRNECNSYSRFFVFFLFEKVLLLKKPPNLLMAELMLLHFLFLGGRWVFAKGNLVAASLVEVGSSEKVKSYKGYVSKEKLMRRLERQGEKKRTIEKRKKVSKKKVRSSDLSELRIRDYGDVTWMSNTLGYTGLWCSLIFIGHSTYLLAQW